MNKSVMVISRMSVMSFGYLPFSRSHIVSFPQIRKREATGTTENNDQQTTINKQRPTINHSVVDVVYIFSAKLLAKCTMSQKTIRMKTIQMNVNI